MTFNFTISTYWIFQNLHMHIFNTESLLSQIIVFAGHSCNFVISHTVFEEDSIFLDMMVFFPKAR